MAGTPKGTQGPGAQGGGHAQGHLAADSLVAPRGLTVGFAETPGLGEGHSQAQDVTSETQAGPFPRGLLAELAGGRGAAGDAWGSSGTSFGTWQGA